jgi:hypothetical protein
MSILLSVMLIVNNTFRVNKKENIPMNNKAFDVSTHFESRYFKHLRVPSAPVDMINSSIKRQARRAEDKLTAKDWCVALLILVAGSFFPVVAASQVLVPYVAPVLAIVLVTAGFLSGNRSK